MGQEPSLYQGSLPSSKVNCFYDFYLNLFEIKLFHSTTFIMNFGSMLPRSVCSIEACKSIYSLAHSVFPIDLAEAVFNQCVEILVQLNFVSN